MNRKQKIYAIIWAILLIAFNVVAFTVHTQITQKTTNTNFWILYGFITASMIIQLICTLMAFKSKNQKELFYNLPVICVSWIGLILQIIFGIVAICVPAFPVWICVIICVVICGVDLISCIASKAGSEMIQSSEKKHFQNRSGN